MYVKIPNDMKMLPIYNKICELQFIDQMILKTDRVLIIKNITIISTENSLID